MKPAFRIAVVFAAGLSLLGAAPAVTPDAARRPFETLRLSAELARRGGETRDPLLLLAAARLRRSVAVRSSEDMPDRADGWIAQAESLGGDDPRVASLAADIRAAATKGRAAGPRVSASLVRGGERRSFVENFRAGMPAVVYLEGDGDSDLALSIGTSSGVACRDSAPGDVKICAWTPRASEPVRVSISNVGTVQNRFILGTN